MTSDQKMAALGGIMSAVVISMAFFGNDWMALFRLVHSRTSPRSSPALFSPPSAETARSVPRTQFQSSLPSLQAPSFRTPGKAQLPSDISRRNSPVPSSQPVLPLSAVSDAVPRPPAVDSEEPSIPPEHRVPASPPALPGKILSSNRIFAPYWYQHGELIGRVFQESEASVSQPSLPVSYQLHQQIRHTDQELEINLALTLPSDKSQEKSAVIFSQPIPDGWDFIRLQGCSGWHMQKAGTLKFLASPDTVQTPLQISLFFTPGQPDSPLPPIEKATCAIQCPDGNRKLCHAE